jgi:hypothetical protein
MLKSIFKRNTPMLAAAGIKGMRIQHRILDQLNLLPLSCGGALHAPMLALMGGVAAV